MTLDEAIHDLNERFSGRIGEPYSKCETGDEYVEIFSGGVMEQSNRLPDRPPCRCMDDATAVHLWHDAVIQYANGRKGVLYWRDVPSISRYSMNYNLTQDTEKTAPISVKLCHVYSRLVISDKIAGQSPSSPGLLNAIGY